MNRLAAAAYSWSNGVAPLPRRTLCPCSHYLFLDADVCFVETQTIPLMLDDLERTPLVFGIGPRMSWDGVNEIPLEVRQANPDICDARLHPCCALIPNTPLLRRIVDVIGLACVRYLWADREEYLDTFKLMTRVMQTHGLRHILSSVMIQHPTFCVRMLTGLQTPPGPTTPCAEICRLKSARSKKTNI